MEPASSFDTDDVDRALSEWRQGDFSIGEFWFVLREVDESIPLGVETVESKSIDGSDLHEEQVLGMAIISQTCDIVRSYSERPYLNVCPLVEITSSEKMEQIRKGMRPRYGWIPGASRLGLTVDFDRMMTVSKRVVYRWKRTVGWHSDEEIRSFQKGLIRKLSRFAFPTDFCTFVQPLIARIKKKHDKASDEGEALRLCSQIRVTANPSWDSETVELMFWFIVDELDFELRKLLTGQVKNLFKPLSSQGRFSLINYEVILLNDMSALEYLDSDQLDLDNLSKSN